MIITIISPEYLLLSQEIDNLVRSLLAKRPDSVVKKIDKDSYSLGELNSIACQAGLFGNKSIVVISRLDNDQKKELLNNLDTLKTSQNLFVLALEGEVADSQKNLLKKHSFQYKELKKPKQNQTNIFAALKDIFTGKKSALEKLYAIDTQEEAKLWGTLFWYTKVYKPTESAKIAKQSYTTKHQRMDFKKFLFKTFLENVNN